MGMYTECVFAVELKGMDRKAQQALESMLDGSLSDRRPESLPNHPIFSKSRARFMLRCASAYFPGRSDSYLYRDSDGDLFLTCRFNVKNYEDEIETFLDFIAPYVDEPNEPVGYMRYEEEYSTVTMIVACHRQLLLSKASFDVPRN